MKKADAPQILLVIAAFLAPLIGGQVNLETASLPAGPLTLLRSVFSSFDSILAYYISGYEDKFPFGIHTPTLSHALVGLFITAATLLIVGKRQVFQVPFQRVSLPLIAFLVWLVCTLAFSSFVSISIVVLAEWVIYGMMFFAVVASAGRRQGSKWIIVAIVVGCTLVAMKGLAEYGSESIKNPSWRVFSTWINPTSLAGILSMGAMLSLGLAIRNQRMSAAIPWTAALAMTCCIMVTDARGGILSLLTSLTCLTGFVLAWLPRKQALTGIAQIASVLIIALLFSRNVHKETASHGAVAEQKSPYVLVRQQQPPSASATTPAAPPSSAGGEQSSGFRIQLWKGALKSMKDSPLGTGVGTYRFQSTKSGLTTETQFTHNSYLQMGVEAGVLGFVLLLGFLGIWLLEVVRGCFAKPATITYLRVAVVTTSAFVLLILVEKIGGIPVFPTMKQAAIGSLGFGLIWLYIEVFRKAPNLPAEQNALRACIIAAIVGMLAHSVFESGLYSFGIGVTAFALMGIGLIQGADGVAPEYIPPFLRGTGGVVGFVAGILLLHAGAVETLRARSRNELAIAVSDLRSEAGYAALREANAISDQALSLIPPLDEIDGENWRLKASVTEMQVTRLLALRKAAAYAPSVRNVRQLGIALAENKDFEGAIRNFNLALELDPNNLLTLPKLRDAYVQAGQLDKAIETARRTVEVEKTPYFQIRSLPELIPVETYEARAFLAQHTNNLEERATLLRDALVGYEQYLKISVPLIKQQSQGSPDARIGGETLDLAQFKMQTAAQFAGQLADTYRQLNRSQDQADAQVLEQRFATALPLDAA